MLNKLRSRGLSEAINVLENGSRQAAGSYLIGNTVYPMVNVNLGVLKNISVSFAGNATTSIVVPDDKMWKIRKGSIQLVTDGTVANRYPYLYVVPNFSTVRIYGCTKVTAITASLTRWAYLNKAGLDDTGADSQNISDIKFCGGDTITFGVTSGVAGDAATVVLCIEEYDVV